jgi:cell division protease FtsH
VRRIVSDAYNRARKVLTEHRDRLELVAQTLLEVESLDREAFEKLMEEGEAGQIQPSGAPRPEAEAGEAAVEGTESEDAPPALDLPPAPAPA